MRAVVGATVDDGGRRRAVGERAREGEEVWGIVDRARREARSLGFMRR